MDRTKLDEQIRAGIIDLVNVKASSMLAEVVSVASPICVVKVAEDVNIYRVRLRSVTGATTGELLKPTVGSNVMISRIGKSNEWYVIKYSAVDDITLNINGKWGVKNATEDLKSIMNDLLAAIQALTVTTPAGPSGPPINIADFIAIDVRINLLLNDGT